MIETEHFVNEGFGWECKHCRRPCGEESSPDARARFFREGEAEGGEPRLSSDALARWTDESRKALRCPACGVEEKLRG